MSFGFDPSIILSGMSKPPPEASLNDTLQTLAQLATSRTQNQHVQVQLADLLRKQQQEQTLASIFQKNAGLMPAGPSRDLAQAGFGQQAMAWQDQGAQMAAKETEDRKKKLELETAYRRHIGEMLSRVKDQAGLDAAHQEAAASGDPLLTTYFKHKVPTTYDAAAIKPLADQAISPEKRASLDAMAGRGPIVIGEDGTMMRASGTTATPLKNEETGKVIKARPKGTGGTAGGGGGAGALTPEALEAAVDAFHTNPGSITTFVGRGAAGEARRLRILNRHAEKYPGADTTLAGADYKANAASLAKLQTQADAVDAFEATAEKNLDTFTELASKLKDTGSPLLNASARKFDEEVMGNPDMAAISAARATAVAEIGKVLSGATGAGGLSDAARTEVHELIKPGATVAQIMSAANILKRDMHNRKAAVQGQLKEMRDRISGKHSAKEGGGTPAGKPVDHYLVSPDKKKRVPVYADGTKGPVETAP